MENIKNLFKLQNCLIKIDACEKIIKDGSNINLLKKLKREFEAVKKEFMDKKEKLEEVKNKERNIADEIKEEQRHLLSCEHELYQNNVSDVKLIEKLQNQSESIKNKIKLLEDESVDLLEKEETITSDLQNQSKVLSELKNSFYEFKENSSKKLNDAKEELKMSKSAYEKTLPLIPDDMLKDFNLLVRNKKTAVAVLKNGVCSGCKFKVSAMTMDYLSKGNIYTHCDNCGRILIKEENVEQSSAENSEHGIK